MFKAVPLPPAIAAHHKKCQVASKTVRDELHELYLEYIGVIIHIESVMTYEEFVPTRHPERPGFRTYSE